MTKHHTCPICRFKHTTPKPRRAVYAILWAVLFTVVEVLAALQLHGWISWALWAIAARNVLVAVLWVNGLATLAGESLADDAGGSDV